MKASTSSPPAATLSPRPPPPADAALVKRYTATALDCLRKAKERGWADVVSLKTDTDLEPIRNDPAFKALLDELRRTVKSETRP